MKYRAFFLSLVIGTCMASSHFGTLWAAEKADPDEIASVETPDTTASKAVAPQINANVAGSYLVSRFARDNGNNGAAILSLKRVHEEEPDNISVALQLQGMLLVEGRVKEALEMANDIDRSGHKDPLTTLLLALEELKHDSPESAAAILDNAADVSAAPQLWLPLMQAWVDVSRQKLEKPITLEGIHSDIGRAAPLVNYHMALINSQGGFKDEAAKNFKNAIQDPTDPPLRVMKQLLRFYDQNDAPEQLASVVKEYRESKPAEI